MSRAGIAGSVCLAVGGILLYAAIDIGLEVEHDERLFQQLAEHGRAASAVVEQLRERQTMGRTASNVQQVETVYELEMVYEPDGEAYRHREFLTREMFRNLQGNGVEEVAILVDPDDPSVFRRRQAVERFMSRRDGQDSGVPAILLGIAGCGVLLLATGGFLVRRALRA